MLTSALLALAAATEAASTPAASEPAPSHLHMEAGLHLGWGSYQQRNWSDRDAYGSANDVHFAIGARFATSFWVGGSANVFAFVANTRKMLHSGATKSLPLASGILVGGIAGWAPPRGNVAVDLTLGTFWGGYPAEWGGFGIGIAPAFTYVVKHFGKHGIGVTARLIWIPKVTAGDRQNDDTRYIAGQLGAEWRFN
ncbi:MAG TPA: hypothetical protein VHB79_10450 [Polyangiaceae bacterium]|nr:hypothetical protein [Polyangiaceae bacterium]